MIMRWTSTSYPHLIADGETVRIVGLDCRV